MQIKTLALAGVLLSTVGCGPGTFTLAGWIVSPTDPNYKATFGGVMVAKDTNGNGTVATNGPNNSAVFEEGDTFRGQFQFVDHGPGGARFHAVITGGYVAPPGGSGVVFAGRPKFSFLESSAYFEGTYTPIPRTLGPGGNFEVMIFDDKAAPFIQVDQLWIYLDGGVFDGYSNSVFPYTEATKTGGGSVTFHPEK